MSGDEALIDAFNRGEDIHRATAANVLGIPEEETDQVISQCLAEFAKKKGE